mmetsp:Transcript_45112/g.113623  ORF Transcript_45112/g.113623 Transcript_45112/m.113623 type:complete len:452 (-) Transcript_45112:83-1438(-)
MVHEERGDNKRKQTTTGTLSCLRCLPGSENVDRDTDLHGVESVQVYVADVLRNEAEALGAELFHLITLHVLLEVGHLEDAEHVVGAHIAIDGVLGDTLQLTHLPSLGERGQVTGSRRVQRGVTIVDKLEHAVEALHLHVTELECLGEIFLTARLELLAEGNGVAGEQGLVEGDLLVLHHHKAVCPHLGGGRLLVQLLEVFVERGLLQRFALLRQFLVLVERELHGLLEEGHAELVDILFARNELLDVFVCKVEAERFDLVLLEVGRTAQHLEEVVHVQRGLDVVLTEAGQTLQAELVRGHAEEQHVGRWLLGEVEAVAVDELEYQIEHGRVHIILDLHLQGGVLLAALLLAVVGQLAQLGTAHAQHKAVRVHLLAAVGQHKVHIGEAGVTQQVGVGEHARVCVRHSLGGGAGARDRLHRCMLGRGGGRGATATARRQRRRRRAAGHVHARR